MEDIEMDDFNERRKKQHWHLEKSVSVSHIISTVMIVISALIFAIKMDSRVTMLEQAIMTQHSTDDKQDSERLRVATELKTNLKDINDKLDRLIERAK